MSSSSSLEDYLWETHFQGQFLPQAVQTFALYSAPSKPALLCIAYSLPVWDYIQRHIPALSHVQTCCDLVTGFLQILDACGESQESLENCEIEKLWQVVLICIQFREGKSVSDTSFDRPVKAILAITLGVLKSGSLERKAAAVSFLQMIAAKAETDPDSVFSSELKIWAVVNDIPALLLANPHPELLQRSRPFFHWLHSAGLLRTDAIPSLFRSAIQSHESFSACAFDLLLGLVPKFSEEDIQGLTTVVSQVDVSEFDPSTLGFLSKMMSQLPTIHSGTVNSLNQILKVLEPLVFQDEGRDEDCQTAAMTTYVSALRSEIMKEKAIELFQRLMQNLLFEVKSQAAKFLSRLLEGFRDKEAVVTEAFETAERLYGNSFGIILLASVTRLIHSDESESWKAEKLTWILKCVHAANSIASIVTIAEVATLSTLLFMQSRSSALTNAFLEFMRDCAKEETWCTPDVLYTWFTMLIDQNSETELFSNLNQVQYDCIRSIFLYLNKGFLEFKEDTYITRLSSKLASFSIFLSLVSLVQHPSIFHQATDQLLEFLFLSEISSPTLFKEAMDFLFQKLEENNTLAVRSLTVVQTIVDFVWRNRDKDRSAEGLEACLTRCLKEGKVSVPFGNELSISNCRDKIESLARENDAHYFQIKGLRANKDTSLFLRVSLYVPQDLSFLPNLYHPQLKKALSSSFPPLSILAYRFISDTISTSNICMEIDQLSTVYEQSLSDSDITQRTIRLLALHSLSKNSDFRLKYTNRKSDLLTLLRLLRSDVNPTDILRFHKHRFLMYIEVLLSLIDTHFVRTKTVLNLDDLLIVFRALEYAALYFSMPEMDKGLETTIPISVQNLFLVALESGANEIISKISKTDLGTVVTQGLVLSDSEDFRKSLYDCLTAISTCCNQFSDRLQEALFESKEKAFQHVKTAKYFFMLLADVYQESSDVSGLTNRLVPALRDAENGLLSTLTSLAEKLANGFSEEQALDLARGVLDGLFPLSSLVSRPSDSENRTLGLGLLRQMAEMHGSVLEFAVKALGTYHRDMTWRKPGIKWWRLSTEVDSPKEFLGIKNLGATCYMNSIFQQLYTIDSFTSGVLSAESKSDFLLLPQFQRLLLDLQYKRKSIASTEDLLTCCPGAPLDPREQMDADEFLNTFMHQLESELSQTGETDLIQDLFKGKIVTTLQGKGSCNHTRNSTQSFLTLGLEICNKSTLAQSLESFSKLEVLRGNNMIECQECGGNRVVAESRQRIIHLPNVLILALRRFGFDIAAMKRHKICSFCEFPEELNMRGVSMNKDLPEEYYQYRLRGVVIHFGIAEAGHYYSLIKCGERWLKFDDTIVEPFDLDHLPFEAFGLKEPAKGKMSDFQLAKSAYLLIYSRDRKYKYPEDEKESLTPLTMDRVPNMNSEAAAAEEKAGKKTEFAKKKRVLFSEEYSRFVTSLLQSSISTPQVLNFVISFFLTISCRKKDWWKDRSLFDLLLSQIESTPSISFWALEVLSTDGILQEFAISTPEKTVKKAFLTLIRKILTSVSETQSSRFVYKLIGKMEKLSNFVSVDLAQFFELAYQAAILCFNAAKEHQLCERLISKWVPQAEFRRELSEKQPIFHQDSYLGHPSPLNISPPPLSSQVHIGFQLAILNHFYLQIPEIRTVFMEQMTSISVDWMHRPSSFEQAQVARLLSHFERDSLVLADLLVTGFADCRDEEEDYLLSTIRPMVQLSDGNLLEPVINMILSVFPTQTKLSKTVSPQWVKLVAAFYSLFPQHEMWGSECLRNSLRKQRERSDSSRRRLIDLILERGIATEYRSMEQSLYGRTFPPGTKLRVFSSGENVETSVVAESYELFHVLQTRQGPSWLSAEADFLLV